MFSAMRRRIHLSPATVIAGLALVFAMTGGAYAAKKYLITSTKQISPSVLKALQGKTGARGANGAPGAAGPQGSAGPQGPAGPSGAQGEKGVQGERGPQGEKGTTGTSGTPGKQGATGATGATGTTGYTATLPSGQTEMGYWSSASKGLNNAVNYALAAISFPIPLAAPSKHVVYLNEEETETSVGSGGCEYEVENQKAKPIAPPDTLCIFTFLGATGKVEFIGNNGAELGDSSAGTLIWGRSNAIEIVDMHGVWAVTAP